MGGGGGEPEVERGVGLARREHGEALGQAQRRAVEAGAGNAFGDSAEAAAEGQAVGAFLGGHRLDLDRGVAAQATEQDCQPSADLGQGDTGSVVNRGGIETAGEGVPQFPDGFFGFPWLEARSVIARPHP